MKQRRLSIVSLTLALCMTLCVSLFAGCQSRGDKDKTSSSSASSSRSSSSSSTPSAPSSSSEPSSVMPPDDDLTSSSLPDSSAMPEPEMPSSSSTAEPAAAAGSADFSKIGALSGTSVVWGPGKNFDGDNRPTACIGLQEQYGSYGCKFIGDKADKKIYLTFDQGYENGCTTKILDTLKEKKTPAVFFLTGHYINTSSDLIQRMVEEGHVLGNHSNHHYDPTETPLEEVSQDMMELHEMVRDQFGYTCTLYRCPEGKFSEQTLALARQNGYTPVFWSFAYADWNPDAQMSPSEALEQLTARLHNGAIYLLHSVSSTNAAVLGDFIDAARAQGYEFAAMEA